MNNNYKILCILLCSPHICCILLVYKWKEVIKWQILSRQASLLRARLPRCSLILSPPRRLRASQEVPCRRPRQGRNNPVWIMGRVERLCALPSFCEQDFYRDIGKISPLDHYRLLQWEPCASPAVKFSRKCYAVDSDKRFDILPCDFSIFHLLDEPRVSALNFPHLPVICCNYSIAQKILVVNNN